MTKEVSKPVPEKDENKEADPMRIQIFATFKLMRGAIRHLVRSDIGKAMSRAQIYEYLKKTLKMNEKLVVFSGHILSLKRGGYGMRTIGLGYRQPVVSPFNIEEIFLLHMDNKLEKIVNSIDDIEMACDSAFFNGIFRLGVFSACIDRLANWVTKKEDLRVFANLYVKNYDNLSGNLFIKFCLLIKEKLHHLVATDSDRAYLASYYSNRAFRADTYIFQVLDGPINLEPINEEIKHTIAYFKPKSSDSQRWQKMMFKAASDMNAKLDKALSCKEKGDLTEKKLPDADLTKGSLSRGEAKKNLSSVQSNSIFDKTKEKNDSQNEPSPALIKR